MNMKLIDLTRLLDPKDYERLPEAVRPASVNIVPRIEYISPGTRGREVMSSIFGIEGDQLPNGEGWGDESMQITTHLGTHVDAPLHYGMTCEGRPSRTITDIDLSELYCDGFVLDLRERCKQGEGISVAALQEAIDENGATLTEGCALMIRTGQERYDVSDNGFYVYPGMTREGTLFLAETGARILGTDALGWDRPFHIMREAFEKTGDPSEIWDGHFAGRDKEVFIVQQLSNLAALPASGFKVGFFPLRLANCSASPARVVAFLSA
jgi:kynurenine formamidase